MSTWLDAMEAEGSLVFDQDRYSHEVRTELTSMSAATIDRYLAPPERKTHYEARAAPVRATCSGTRSASAKPAMKWKPNQGSSKSTPSLTAAPP